MSTEKVVHPANEVSDAFVNQYFHILENVPEQARKLYVADSVVSRPAPDGTMMSFTSVEAIDEQILSCDYKGATFELISVDSQHSFESGILIMVIGFVTGKDKIRRKFYQSFYLARQESIYVVLNDILRYVDDESSNPPVLPVSNSIPVNEMAMPADEQNQAKPVNEPEKLCDIAEVAPSENGKIEKSFSNDKAETAEKPVNEPENPADELDQAKPHQKIDASVENYKDVAEVAHSENAKIEKSDTDDKAETAEEPTEPVAETIAPTVQLDAGKRSFAAIVQSMAHNAAPFKAPAQKRKPMVQPRAAAVTPQAPGSEKKNDHKIVDEPGTSIFVANLPMDAMPDDLHGLFKEFGPIKENGIQVRSSRNSGICFGFVAFQSASSVQSVLQAAMASPFMLKDRKLRVKEKQVDYEGSKPSGRNGGVSRTQQQQQQNNGEDGKRRDNASRNRRNGHERSAASCDSSRRKANTSGGGGGGDGHGATNSQAQD